jgi:hypothetical protein
MDPINPYASPHIPIADHTELGEQPLTVLGAMGTGTTLSFRIFPSIAAVTLVVWLPLELLISYREYFVLDPDDAVGAIRQTLLLDAFFGAIATGGVISVGEAALRGRRKSWLAGLGDGVRGWPRLFATQLVAGVVLLLAALIFVLPAFYLAVRYSLSEPAAILEGKVGMRALGRSMQLTRGNFVTFFLLCLFTLVSVALVSVATYLPIALFPAFNHWLVAAALTSVDDLAGSWMTLVFVAAYVQITAIKRKQEQIENSAS